MGFFRITLSALVIALFVGGTFGYINESQEMKQWALQNIDGPPRWLTIGLAPSLQIQLDDLQHNILLNKSPIQATSYVKEFAASIGGYSLAGPDFLAFNELTAL